MPGISNRRQGELLRAAFAVLMDHPEGLPGREVLARMAQLVPFNEYESGHYDKSPDEPRAFRATRFWTINCVKAGWMTKSKGTWRLTDAGRSAFSRLTDPSDFVRESLRIYDEWRAAQPDRVGVSPPELPSEDERVQEREAASITNEEASERAWLQIQDYLVSMKAYDFQELVACLLNAMGTTCTGSRLRDPIGDSISSRSPLGASGPRIKVQVKHRQDKTSAEVLRSFLAILGPQDVGIYISAGASLLMRSARREVRRAGE